MKKSKVDAIIKRKVADARWSGIVEGQQVEREKNTLLMTPQAGSTLLGQQPEFQYMRVPLEPRVGRRPALLRPGQLPSRLDIRCATFRAVQKAWTTQEGHLVAWFEWQFEGVS